MKIGLIAQTVGINMKKYYCDFEINSLCICGFIYQDSNHAQRIGWIDINTKEKAFLASHVDGIGFEWIDDLLDYLDIRDYKFINQ